MRRILIVGAGQSGLQLALGLRADGYDVTLVSARTPDDLRAGRPLSTQGMFHDALETERALGLDLWEGRAPAFEGFRVTLSAPPGPPALAFNARLSRPGQSVDQRLKMAAWLELAERRGVTVEYRAVGTGELADLAARHDLTVVAAGKGDLVSVFARDPRRSVHDAPQRALAVAYVHGLAPDPDFPAPHIGFHAVPGLGELVVVPALTLSGPCDILFWEAVPGGPLDRWAGPGPIGPGEHLATTLELASRYVPWVAERAGAVELTDDRATLYGRFAPVVREPVARLDGDAVVLGMADVVVANDPITGQGSNTAAKCATAYRAAIRERGGRPFDEGWMRATAEAFWSSTARPVTDWTNAMLQPLPPHVQRILGAAAGNPVVATRFADGFCDPADLEEWFLAPEAAERYLASV
ncbi:alanine-phosphoribitol ligase [Amorphoplanes nipponensis]|uniref:Alanine-phosphoribitol ligase n=1 Tax=Actinoplanes nipponensis TaxID=135950 RepID=A0A919MQK5_9ACTN|nr:styrene monooxygenase/indole monooxygenase family protein [Actinoplanes nipponensis]GIE53751.1 alanine-phosphoribitol ligase [Actinoplanes nipponensis]